MIKKRLLENQESLFLFFCDEKNYLCKTITNEVLNNVK